METTYVNGKRAVTLYSLVNEILTLIPDGDPEPGDVLGRVGYDAKNSLYSKTSKLCNAFAELDSHGGTCEKDSKFFEDAVETAKVALMNGYLRDALCVLLDAQSRGALELSAESLESNDPLCLKQAVRPVEKGGAK